METKLENHFVPPKGQLDLIPKNSIKPIGRIEARPPNYQPKTEWRGEVIRPTEAEARDGYRIWLRYSDGTAGELDLSHLAGRGVFEVWNDRDCFEAVHIGPAGGIAWGQEIELCPDALYMQLTGKSVGKVMLGAGALLEDA